MVTSAAPCDGIPRCRVLRALIDAITHPPTYPHAKSHTPLKTKLKHICVGAKGSKVQSKTHKMANLELLLPCCYAHTTLGVQGDSGLI